jgi:site-specific DNA-methyltransferase (adenine-specific)
MYKYRKTGGSFGLNEGGAGVKCISWDVAPEQVFFDELLRVGKTVIIWGGNYFKLPISRCFLIWDKQQPEDFSMAMCEFAWTNMTGNAKMFRMKPQGKKNDPRFHPTQKPVELYAWILKMFAKSGDKVFDPMMGSQSSRIAAYKLGYDFCGCELDKEYFDKGNERFERECHGIIKMADGSTIKQLSLFDNQVVLNT